MPEPLLTKRLHISGLTPSITPGDLERCLSTFGVVKVLDGFGARNALGDSKNFCFVTMEIGAKELAKCLNVLNGSTWKGAKLRIGEAKPDFRERLASLNSHPSRVIRPKRTHAHNYGYTSPTLPLTPLSATSASSTPGWIVTPSGRIVRPMRMRPERPLEPMHSATSKVKGGVNNKTKKRIKPPPVRARRRLIDPTKWDSVYLKGVFLDSVPMPLLISKDVPGPCGQERPDVVDDVSDGDVTESHTSSDGQYINGTSPFHTVLELPNPQQQEANSSRTHDKDSIDVRDETSAALALLGKMFGDKEDWDARESVEEMETLEDDVTRDNAMQVDNGDVIGIVPLGFGEGERSEPKFIGDNGKRKEPHSGFEDVIGGPSLGREVEMEEVASPMSTQTVAPVLPTNLKTLFAPREDASFSLLDHLELDLDLELDADILGINAPGISQENDRPSQPTLPSPNFVQVPATVSPTKARSCVTLDLSLPPLFPLPDSLPHSYTHSPIPATAIHPHGAPACFLFPSATRVRGLSYLPPSTTFTRSPQNTPESIRERWEKDKSSLTREWKKAWREARGSRKRGTGTGGEIAAGY